MSDSGTTAGSGRVSRGAGHTSGLNAGPIVATLLAIPAAIIVLAALDGRDLPVLGGGRGQLLGLWLVGSIMCGQGIYAMRQRFGGVGMLAGLPFGLVNTALIISALFGWPLLLTPIADAIRGAGPAVSLDRAATVGAGAVMVVKWTIAWISFLPRRVARAA